MAIRTLKQVTDGTARNAPSLTQAEPRPDSFHDLEGDLCDATNMAGILWDRVQDLVTQVPPVRIGETHLFCGKDDRDKLAYAACEVSGQLLALKDRFYAIYNAESEGKKSTAEPEVDALDIGWKAARWLPFDPVLFLHIALQCRAPVTWAASGVTYWEPEGPSEVYEFMRGWRNAAKNSNQEIAVTLRRRATLRDAHTRLAKSLARKSRSTAKGGDA